MSDYTELNEVLEARLENVENSVANIDYELSRMNALLHWSMGLDAYADLKEAGNMLSPLERIANALERLIEPWQKTKEEK